MNLKEFLDRHNSITFVVQKTASGKHLGYKISSGNFTTNVGSFTTNVVELTDDVFQEIDNLIQEDERRKREEEIAARKARTKRVIKF